MNTTHTDEKPEVKVDVFNFPSLFSSDKLPLAVDTYQRGFVWGKDKVQQLIEDLQAYQEQPDPKPPYYMGTVLLHRNPDGEKRFVIDGQQRLTALCVLHHRLKNELPPNFALSYSPQSARNIKTAAKQCRDGADKLDAVIFERVEFTVVEVDRVDLAFTFFDTQNNRGVPLQATDLLKAYHLRAVKGDTVALQTQCAQRWERMQRGKQVLPVQKLFTHFLWRARRWTGKNISEHKHDALLKEFQPQNWQEKDARNTTLHNTIPLYRARSNRLGVTLSLGTDGQTTVHTAPIAMSPGAANLPFSIRQPIHPGVGFFLYVEKYAALLQWLTQEETQDQQIIKFREVREKLVKKNSLFLEEIYLLAALMYVDQFGSEKLFPFALWLEHALGAVRVEKQQVRQESAQNFFRDNPVMSLLDVIAGAFHPEQVIEHLALPHYHFGYQKEQIDLNKNGVQATYKKAAQEYFGQPDNSSLAAKSIWIKTHLENKG